MWRSEESTDEEEERGNALRECNLDWNSDFDFHYIRPSWELYPSSDEDNDDGHGYAGPCPECISDEEPHFRLQILHGTLALPRCNEPAMDPFLWRCLPPEILERVLAMVPAPATFRLSLVCKHWLSLFSSIGFKKLCFEVAQAGYGAGRVKSMTSNGIKGKVGIGAEPTGLGVRESSKKLGSDERCAGHSAERLCEDSGELLSDAFNCKQAIHDSARAGVREGQASDGELGAGGSCGSVRKSLRGKRRSTEKAGKKKGKATKASDFDNAHLAIYAAEQAGSCATKLSYGEGVADEDNSVNASSLTGMSDIICALEYVPGRLCPGCQPRMSEISYMYNDKVYAIGLSFLPEKFQLFLPPDCVSQDGFVCLFRAESFASPDSAGASQKMKKLSFCVANPLTRSWKELPTEVCTCREFKKWREDWTVCLEVQNDEFTVCLLTPREKDGSLTMTVNTYSSRRGTWKLTFLQNMRYVPPVNPLEGEGKWPCYTISNGFVCTGNYGRAQFETMVHNIETGELVYSPDDIGSGSSSEDDFGDNPSFRVSESSASRTSYERGMELPFRLTSSHKGLFCAARFFIAGYQLSFDQAGSVEEHMKRAMDLYLKQHRRAGYAIWKLDLSSGRWNKISKSTMPHDMVQKLKKRPPWDPYRVYRGQGPKDVRTLHMDAAVVVGETVYLNLGVKEDYNFIISSNPDLRLWSGMVAYHIPNDSWQLIYHGLLPHVHGNDWHIFRPTFTDFCLY